MMKTNTLMLLLKVETEDQVRAKARKNGQMEIGICFTVELLAESVDWAIKILLRARAGYFRRLRA